MVCRDIIEKIEGDYELIQTYISWVLLGDGVVYKIKKPIKFQFIDYSTLEKRKHFCEEEIRLNSRLSPEIYIGVVPICLEKNGKLTLEGISEPVEYAVKMKRIPSEKQLNNLINSGRIFASQIETIAERIFNFHQKTKIVSKNAHNYPDTVKKLCIDDTNLILKASHGDLLDRKQFDVIKNALFSFLNDNYGLLSERQQDQKVRECHGDLRTENIYWDENPIFIDCIEFNKEYRYLDIIWEVAYLAAAIDALGRRDLSDALIEKYIYQSKQPVSSKLINFHKCHMAIVLAKLHILKFEQTSDEKLLPVFNMYMDLAEEYALQYL